LNHKEDHEQAVSTDAHEPSGQWLSKSLLIFKNQKRDKKRRRRETLGTRVGQVRECPPLGSRNRSVYLDLLLLPYFKAVTVQSIASFLSWCSFSLAKWLFLR